MNQFENTYSQASSTEEKDLIMKEAIRKVMDKGLRNKWSKDLELNYGITRNKKEQQKRFKIIPMVRIMSIAASLALILFIGQQAFLSKSNSSQLAMEYLTNESVFHPGLIKGAGNEDFQSRQLAIHLFDTKKYSEAVIQFNFIKNKSDEDIFYLSLSYLYSKEYDTAVSLFDKLRTNSTTYNQEISWYKSLAHILNENSELGKSELLGIQPGDWNYEKAQKLIQVLD